ncbi:MAG: hypothetical protein ACOCXG_04360 [Nanoarchaeota archaeon]
MKKINIITLILVTFGLLFAGCSGDGDSRTSGFGGAGSGSSSSGGNGGVVVDFAENQPPSEIFKGNKYNFAFVIKNHLEHPITDLQIKTKGYDRGFVTGLDESYDVSNVPAASEQAGPGVYPGLIVSGISVDGFEGDYNFNPTFDYAYSAKSTFAEQICVPSKVNSCDVDVSASTSQNGILKIKFDRINSVEDRVRLEFTVINQGDGQVVNEFFNTENYAPKYSLDFVKLGTISGECSPVGSENYQIIGGKAQFYCDFKRSGDDSYASQVTAELSYKYQQSVQKKIKVKSLN